MLNSLKDIFDLAMQGCALLSGKKDTVAEKTFQEVFNNIQETSRNYKEKSAQPSQPSKKEDHVKASHEQKPAQPVKTSAKNNGANGGKVSQSHKNDQTDPAPKKADAAQNDNKPSTAQETQAEKLAKTAKEIEDRISKLKETNPDKYNELVNNIDNISLKDLLSALGLAQGQITAVGQITDVNAKLTDEMKTAVVSGKAEDLLAGFKSLGLGEKDVRQLMAIINGKGSGEANPAMADAPSPKGIENMTPVKADSHPLTATNAAIKQAAAANPAQPQTAGNTNQPQQNAAMNMNVQHAAFKMGADAVSAVSNDGGQNSDFNVTSGGHNGRAELAQGMEKPAEATRGAFDRMLMNQIVDKVKINIRQNGASSISIKLDPPSLGKIDMRIVTHENQVKAVMVTESREVKAIIERDINGLKASLNNDGLKVDQITVTTAEDQSQFRNENLAREFGQNRGRGGARVVGAGAGGVAGVDGGVLTAARASYHDGILDVVA